MEKKNYLRKVRLSAGLKQQDVTCLMGLKSPDTVSRIEHHKWMPSIGVLIAYRIIFNADLHSLIPQFFDRQYQAIQKRAVSLKKDLERRKRTKQVGQRISALETIIAQSKSLKKDQ